MVKELWVEKYRPRTIQEYVFKDMQQRKQVEQWIEEKSIPHLLFWGGAGTGKTTLAKVLIRELGVQDADVMYINASRDNGVDHIRQRVTNFCSSMPWGEFKVVLLDEADYLSKDSQATLRGMLEEYADTVRFIMTCNYVNKILVPMRSRMQEFHISEQEHTDFTARIAEILIEEKVEMDLDTIDLFVRSSYPDLRKTINTVQQNITDGVLNAPSVAVNSTSDWRIQMVSKFREGKTREARNIICKHATPDVYDEMFQFLYRNLDFFGANEDEQDQAVVIIRNGMVKHTMVADPEINFSATMIELEGIGK
jgi:replication factor C small subunit